MVTFPCIVSAFLLFTWSILVIQSLCVPVNQLNISESFGPCTEVVAQHAAFGGGRAAFLFFSFARPSRMCSLAGAFSVPGRPETSVLSLSSMIARRKRSRHDGLHSALRKTSNLGRWNIPCSLTRNPTRPISRSFQQPRTKNTHCVFAQRTLLWRR